MCVRIACDLEISLPPEISLYVENSEVGGELWHAPPTSSVGDSLTQVHTSSLTSIHHSQVQYCLPVRRPFSFQQKESRQADIVTDSTMTRTRKKNAIRAGCALPPREAAARRTNVTSDVKAATVQSILFKFSTLFSDPWHEGYPVKTATNEQYVLQTVRNSTPFAVDLIRFQHNEGQRRAVGALIQSFQFPSSAHNLSVCT